MRQKSDPVVAILCSSGIVLSLYRLSFSGAIQIDKLNKLILASCSPGEQANNDEI